MGTIATLLSPFDYLWIRHSLKRAVDFGAPALGAVTGGVVVALWGRLNLFGDNGLVLGVNDLVQILAGFFITSLAVIATFNGATYHIDDVFEGHAALLEGEPLTRRQFLCHLFAYLALASVVLYLLGVVALTVATSLHGGGDGAGESQLRIILRTIFAVVYLGGFGHLIGTTLIGLIFLSSRMSRVAGRDRFSTRPKLNPDKASETASGSASR